MRLLASTAAPTNSSKCVAPSTSARLMPRPRNSTRDAAFDAGAEALPLLERPAFFKRFPFGASLASRLRDAGEGDAGCPAGLKVLFVKEAAIGTIQMRHGMKDGFVAVERRPDMDLVGRIPAEHAILSHQPAPALSQEHLVPELHRFQYLPPLDQIGVGFEDGVELLLGGHLLALEDATARLTDHPGGELTVARDLTAEGVDRGGLRDETEPTNPHGSLDDGSGLGDDLFGTRMSAR